MNTINQIARFLLGALFIFSGFVKSVDPYGTTYKVLDYFKAGGAPIPENVALGLAIALCAAELFVGLALFLNIKIRVTSWISLFFMGGFTIITLVLALTNKVGDCGCFGDAFKLTNWQTFFKNLIILPFAVLVFWQRNRFKESLHPTFAWLVLTFLLGFSVFFNFYNIRHLPLINYRPYMIGQNIWDAMQRPSNAPADVYDIKLVYEKNGVKKEFNEQNFPWQDTTWKFVEQKSTLVKKGYTPPIHDFSMLSPTEGDVTEKILKKKGEVYLFIASNITKANTENAKKANAIYEECKKKNVPFIMLSASTGKQVDDYRALTGAAYPIYATDETALKTAMRSNPGLIMLYNGAIVGMWSGYDIPSSDFFKENTFNKQLAMTSYYKDGLTITLLICGLLLFGLLLFTLRTNYR